MTDSDRWTACDSPLGTLTLRAGERGLNGLFFAEHTPGGCDQEAARAGGRIPILADAVEQLEEYFAGARAAFELRLDPSVGTAFQHAVWAQLERIPCGATHSYCRSSSSSDRLRCSPPR